MVSFVFKINSLFCITESVTNILFFTKINLQHSLTYFSIRGAIHPKIASRKKTMDNRFIITRKAGAHVGQNIEIEFKNLLERAEFKKIGERFSLIEDSFKKQVNHYFDTSEFSLKDKRSALRIREKGGQFILTLKQPHGDGLLETDQLLSPNEAEAALEEGTLPTGRVADEIGKLGVNVSNLSYFGTLATSRAELPYQNGLLVLDHSTYLDTEDYELEYEAADYNEGKQTFQTLLHQLGIPARKTPNKIHRFYTRKLELK